jgi:transcriptional regulator with PAS, ATPase and Fis domain
VHYRISWLGGFEINPRDQAASELDKTRSLQLKTNWMTINEIRQLEGLERLPGADVVLGLSQLQNGAPQNISSATSKRKLELERKFRKPVDQLLAERIAAGKSVNRICKELGIGKQTFYSWTEEYELRR